MSNLPLGGVPIAIKDMISVAGQPCTCASKILRNYRALYDATVIRKLRAAGAIPFGKTNMDEFAMGSSTENSSVKVTRNPWDISRVPGGSSGGSAAAVAADEAFGALGTDTGGSIRQPAALSRRGRTETELRPRFALWPGRVRLVARSSGPADQNGARCRADHECDRRPGPAGLDLAERARCRITPLISESDLRGMRLGLPKEYMIEGIDPQVRAAVDAAVAHFNSLGAEIVEVSLPHTEYAIAAYYMIATRRSVGESRALRRRALRTSRGESAELARSLRPDAGGRIRSGSEAAHHSRHLRSQLGILRRLLFARAKSAGADPPGFRAGI